MNEYNENNDIWITSAGSIAIVSTLIFGSANKQGVFDFPKKSNHVVFADSINKTFSGNHEGRYVDLTMNLNKENNLRKLDEIKQLNDNWDGENSKSFSTSLIQKVRNILMCLNVQPELFPTGCETIQLEYDGENDSYLEFEISDKPLVKVFRIDQNQKETSYNIDIADIEKEVNKFYG